MANLQISKGQGLSQAIASKLGLSKTDLKGIKLETWQSVMTVIKDEQEKRNKTPEDDNIFTGGSDVSTINTPSNWKNNFVVQEGSVNIGDESWDKILDLLGKKEKVEDAKPEDPKPETKPETKPEDSKPQTKPELQDIPDGAKVKRRDVMNVGEKDSKESVAKVKDKDGNKVYYQVETNPQTHEEKLGQKLIADSRGLKKNQYYAIDDTIPQTAKADLKTVDGKKDSVIVSYKDDKKVRHYYSTITNENGTIGRGEELYPIAGSSKFYSQTKINEHLKKEFGTDKLPEGITVQLMQYYSEVQFIYKQNGKSIDAKEVERMVKEQQQTSTKTEQK